MPAYSILSFAFLHHIYAKEMDFRLSVPEIGKKLAQFEEMHGHAGSTAAQYCAEHDIDFVLIKE
ncbi:hypothetical protein [uncultured Neglectibacter sp.]|uniref:hypothetical protein n=1 Tax=uncultured Neglectibacter sp. TaxID=1924108 RepID=UPI0034E010E5